MLEFSFSKTIRESVGKFAIELKTDKPNRLHCIIKF